jgi:hypothetical protein
MPYKNPADKKAWGQRNKARWAAASRRYRQAHPERKRTYRQIHSLFLCEYDRQYRRRHRAAIAVYQRIWKNLNSAKVAAEVETRMVTLAERINGLDSKLNWIGATTITLNVLTLSAILALAWQVLQRLPVR